MSPLEIVAIIGMVVYAIYMQSKVMEVTEHGRFKMAIIYGIIAVAVGGFAAPQGATAWSLLAASLVLSLVVGLARGALTRIWLTPDGRIMRKGTVLSIGLFLALVVVKFGMGTFAYLEHLQDGGGFAEIMLMIAVMAAVQAQIVWRRGAALQASTPAPLTTVDA